jgi:hypothetical protein
MTRFPDLYWSRVFFTKHRGPFVQKQFYALP